MLLLVIVSLATSIDGLSSGCRTGGAAAAGGKAKRSKQPLAQLVEVDISGAPVMPQRAPVAQDASVDPFIGRYIQYAFLL